VRPRPRRPDRGAGYLDAFGAEQLVEGARELAISVADQEARVHVLIVKRHDQVPSLLDNPRRGGVGRDSGRVHAPSRQVEKVSAPYAFRDSGDGVPPGDPAATR